MAASKRQTERPSPTTDFLTAAQDRLRVNGGTTADKRAAEERSKKRAEEYTRRQLEFLEQHMQPLLKELQDLPLQNGRRFRVEIDISIMNPEKPKLAVGLWYVGKPGPMQRTYDKLFMVMDDFEGDNAFFMRAVRFDRDHPENRHDFETIPIVASVQQLHSEIGRFVADVAPDRVAELVENRRKAAAEAEAKTAAEVKTAAEAGTAAKAKTPKAPKP